MSSEVSSGCSVRSRPTSQTSTDTLTCDDLPLGGDAPDMPPPNTTNMPSTYHPHLHAPSHSHSHHHRRARTPRHAHHGYTLRTPDPTRENQSPANVESPGDAFLDSAFVSDCDACDPVEHHSSEEELETLTGSGSWQRETAGPPEKRKWSQVARLSLTDSGMYAYFNLQND